MHRTLTAIAAAAATAALTFGLAQPASAADDPEAPAAEPSEIIHVTPTWKIRAVNINPVRPEAQLCPPSHPWLVDEKKERAPGRYMPRGSEAITNAYYLQLRVNSIGEGAGDGKVGGVGNIQLFNDGVTDIEVHFRLHCTNDPNRAYPR
ncbi:hypothetical protein [Agromyces silvae]|uniref:hypothetical protein n=1 Tax=Agromyces silvae TaxID=3388266 RepID=UPI00280A75BD|nr:hypothetical protein [Agromyces protaetiae]